MENKISKRNFFCFYQISTVNVAQINISFSIVLNIFSVNENCEHCGRHELSSSVIRTLVAMVGCCVQLSPSSSAFCTGSVVANRARRDRRFLLRNNFTVRGGR